MNLFVGCVLVAPLPSGPVASPLCGHVRQTRYCALLPVLSNALQRYCKPACVQNERLKKCTLRYPPRLLRSPLRLLLHSPRLLRSSPPAASPAAKRQAEACRLKTTRRKRQKNLTVCLRVRVKVLLLLPKNNSTAIQMMACASFFFGFYFYFARQAERDVAYLQA